MIGRFLGCAASIANSLRDPALRGREKATQNYSCPLFHILISRTSNSFQVPSAPSASSRFEFSGRGKPCAYRIAGVIVIATILPPLVLLASVFRRNTPLPSGIWI